MRTKLTVHTVWLIQQLQEISKYLRDCSEDIIEFSKFFADRLDWVDEATLKPWDFIEAWNGAIKAAVATRHKIGPQQEPIHSMKHMPDDSLRAIDRMMPIFATDLCGKEFGEVTEMMREDGVGKTEPFPYQIKPYKTAVENRFEKLKKHANALLNRSADHPISEPLNAFLEVAAKADCSESEIAHSRPMKVAQKEAGIVTPAPCHPFPNGKPIVEEEASRPGHQQIGTGDGFYNDD